MSYSNTLLPIGRCIVVLATLMSQVSFAQTACDSLADQSAAMRASLDQNKSISVPANQTWRVDGLELLDDESINGQGTICKATSSPYALKVSGKNVQISNLTFRPQTVSGQPNCDIQLADGASQVRIQSNHFEGNSYSAICGANESALGGVAHQQPATGVILSQNTFVGYVRPIFLHSVNNITISDNILSDSLHDAIRLRENNGQVLISGNQFINVGARTPSADTQDAIDSFWSGQKLIISDNIVSRTEGVGFDIKGVDPENAGIGSRSVIIANNHISETFDSALVLHGDLDNGQANHTILITGNIIEDSVRSGSYADAVIWAKGAVKYLTIADNQLRSNQARGITVQTRSGQSDGSVAGVHITGNMLINNGVSDAPSSIGIFALGVQGINVSNNTVGNDLTLANPYTRYGIYLSQIVDGIVKNNILRCNSASAISVAGNNIIQADNLTTTTACTL